MSHLPPMPKCPSCDGHTRIDVLRIGRYVCMSCDFSWIEDPEDESTQAEAIRAKLQAKSTVDT